MDASRDILIFNVTPIYSNEHDFIYLFIYLFIFICKFKASKTFMAIRAGGNSLGGSRREGVLLAGQSGRGEGSFFWNNPFYTGCSAGDLETQEYQLFILIFSLLFTSVATCSLRLPFLLACCYFV